MVGNSQVLSHGNGQGGFSHPGRPHQEKRAAGPLPGGRFGLVEVPVAPDEVGEEIREDLLGRLQPVMGTIEALFEFPGCHPDGVDPSPGDGQKGLDEFRVLRPAVAHGVELVSVDDFQDPPGNVWIVPGFLDAVLERLGLGHGRLGFPGMRKSGKRERNGALPVPRVNR